MKPCHAREDAPRIDAAHKATQSPNPAPHASQEPNRHMSDTVQQLHELPELAAEVYLTWGHPNPYRQTEGNRA